MTGIRALERDDLPQVARLYELIMRSGVEENAPPELASFFEKTLLDHPWADAEIPSIVYEDENGSIVGFLASSVRRMQFDGRPIRLACSGHFLSHPRARDRAVGALLLRAYLKGPQDMTISDGATDTVRRMWEGLGGSTVYLRCLSFIKAFRPWRLGADYVLGGRGLQTLEAALRPITFGLDRVTSWVSGEWLHIPEPTGSVEPLTPAKLLEHLPAVTASLRLYPDYDLRYLEWLFPELDEVAGRGPLWGPGEGRRMMLRGPLWAELVRDNGQVLGWYVCNLRRGGFCRILQFAATDRGAEPVFQQLAFRARQRGAAGLYGRVEPKLFPPVSTSRALLRVHEGRMLAHSRAREMVDILSTDSALLTRLDAEWW